MKPVRFGVIGVGNMGSYHARVLAEGRVSGAVLTAVADVDPARLAPWTGAARFGSSAELIRSGAVDAVLIATPHYAHTTIGADALGQGLHVLVEKPISVHKADCQKLIAAYEHRPDRGQVFAAMLNQRADPCYQKIRELVRGGLLGELYRVEWTITDWFRTDAYYAASDWRATWAGEGGGVLLNQATHNLDLFQWMFGLPARVRAVCGFGRYHPIEVEDDVTALFEFANGASGVFVTSTGEAPGTNRLEVVGDRGRLVCEPNRLRFTQTAVSTAAFRRRSEKQYAQPPVTEQVFEFADRGGQHVTILENFVAAIRDGASLIAPAVEGIHSVELANAVLWSAWQNAPVELPLDATGYAQQLQQRIASSQFKKTTIPRFPGIEIAPYLVQEK
jgi:predicted dehydrogenase